MQTPDVSLYRDVY